MSKNVGGDKEMKLRKRIGSVIGICMMLASSSVSASVNGNIEVIANNGVVAFESEVVPIVRDDRVLVPVKYIGDTFGAITDIDTINGVITSRAKGNIIEFKLGSKKYNVKAKEKEMDTEPTIYNNNIYLPLRYAFEIFDVPITWDSVNRAIIVDEDAKSIAEYTEYSYEVDGSIQGKLGFRGNYNSGLAVIPADSYRGVYGDTIVKCIIDTSKDKEQQLSEINKIFKNFNTKVAINTEEMGYNIEGDASQFIKQHSIGNYDIIEIVDSNATCSIQRVKQSECQGYGDVKINGVNYTELDKELVESRKGSKIQLKSGKSVKMGQDRLEEDPKVVIVDKRFYVESVEMYKLQ